MTRRILIALAALLSGCLYAAPAAAQKVTVGSPVTSCPKTGVGKVTCAIGISFTVAPDTVRAPTVIVHDTVRIALPPIHDTVRITIQSPVVHDTIHITTHDTVTVVLHDTVQVSAPPPAPPPVVTPPPPPPPAPPPATSGAPVLGSVLRYERVADSSASGSFYLSHQVTAAGPWSASSASPWVAILNSYNGCACGYDSGNLLWKTLLQGKPLGVYVDTIAVKFTTGTQVFIDSVHVVDSTFVIPVPVQPSSGGGAPPPPPVALVQPAPDSSPLPAHPRVWMTSARLAQLKAQATTNTSRWQVVKQAADASVAKGATVTGGDEFYLPALCAAYLATGNGAYSTRAGLVIAGTANEQNTLQGDSGYAYRFNLPDFIMGLDWCYTGLTAGQRHQAATWLMNRSDWVWPETNPSRTGGWGLWPSNNYYWGFMMSGATALAAAGDDTVPGNRPAYHRALAVQHWTTDGLPYLAGEGLGGAWDEGTSYGVGSQWYLGRFVDAYATSGEPLTTPWLRSSVLWSIESTMPGGKLKAPFGDQARVSDASEYAYDRVAAMDVLAAIGDTTLASQTQSWLNWIGNVASGDDGTAKGTDELIHYNPSAPSGSLSALPRGYLSPGAGYFVDRTSWTDTAFAWTFQAGNVGDGHNSLAANSLMLWQGGWISATANIYSNSGIEQGTQNYNTMTLGDSGQKLYGPNNAQIVESQITDTLVVLRAQAANTYGYPNGTAGGRTVSDYLRTVVFLPSLRAFVIVDRATAIDSTRPKVWRWQMHGTPQISGNTFTLANDAATAACTGTVLLEPVTLGIEARTGQDGNPIGAHSVTVSPIAAHATDYLVTVLQCGAQQAASAVDGASATVVSIGSTHITIPHADSAAVTMQ